MSGAVQRNRKENSELKCVLLIWITQQLVNPMQSNPEALNVYNFLNVLLTVFYYALLWWRKG